MRTLQQADSGGGSLYQLQLQVPASYVGNVTVALQVIGMSPGLCHMLLEEENIW